MAKNISNESLSIQEEFDSFPLDYWNIEKVLLYGNYQNSMIVPVENILDKYRDYFENFLEDTTINENYFYSPAAFAENYYGTPDLDFVVLYFAKMTSIFEFNKKNIKVLPKSKLTELNQLFVKYRAEVEESRNSPEEYIEIDDVISKKQIYL